MARTNIDIDPEVLQEVMRRYRLATKTEAVDVALRRLADAPMTREEALAMEGARALDAIPAVLAHDADLARIATVMDLVLDEATPRADR